MEEKMLSYGVFMGKRFKPKQKEKFLNVIANEFHELGYPVRILKGDEKSKTSPSDLVVGDLANANTIYAAYYDTPAKLLWGNVDYYPLNGTRSMKASLWPTYVPIFGSLLLFVALFIVLLSNKTIGGQFHAILLFVVVIIGLFVSSAISRGIANGTNLNRNTSGVLTLLEVARKLPEEKRKKVAFLLYDKGTSDHAGIKMIALALGNKVQNRQFILVDCVATGSHLGIGYRDANEREARTLANAYKGNRETVLIHLDEKKAVYTGSFFVPKSVVVCSGKNVNGEIAVSHTASKKDVDWDEEEMNAISDMLVSFIKK
ncbi:MAG: hypothetical protein PUF50_07095 [Erysipelotrichaceae bacterium]|nr:hypothetical protein [Erysipelotrichaceae bacterium]